MSFIVIGIVSTFVHTTPLFDTVKTVAVWSSVPPPAGAAASRASHMTFSDEYNTNVQDLEQQPNHHHHHHHHQPYQHQRERRHRDGTLRFMTGNWIGNTWVPPPPWRLYNAKELLEYYKDKNVVIVGDSLARRFFATFYYILKKASENENEEDNEIATVNGTTGNNDNQTSTTYDLNNDSKNNNKNNNIPFSYVEDQKKMDAQSVELQPKCTDPIVLKEFHRTPSCCLDMPGGYGHTDSMNRTVGKLILIQPVYCSYHMTQFFQGESTHLQERRRIETTMDENNTTFVEATTIGQNTQQQQQQPRPPFADVVLVANGAWDEGFPSKCHSDRSKIKSLVDEMESYQRLTSPHTQVIYRTPGYFDGGSARSNSTIIDEISTNAMDFIDELYRRRSNDTANTTTTTTTNNTIDGEASASVGANTNDASTSSNDNDTPKRQTLTYVNWGGAVSPRSHNGERIVGDHVAHYGLEPRLALLQMMTNRLMELGGYQLVS